MVAANDNGEWRTSQARGDNRADTEEDKAPQLRRRMTDRWDRRAPTEPGGQRTPRGPAVWQTPLVPRHVGGLGDPTNPGPLTGGGDRGGVRAPATPQVPPQGSARSDGIKGPKRSEQPDTPTDRGDSEGCGTLKRASDVTCRVRVTDDFGHRVEVRYGEVLILGRLIEDVIAKLQAEKANDR